MQSQLNKLAQSCTVHQVTGWKPFSLMETESPVIRSDLPRSSCPQVTVPDIHRQASPELEFLEIHSNSPNTHN